MGQNILQNGPDDGFLLSVDSATGAQSLVATGMRNSVGIAVAPVPNRGGKAPTLAGTGGNDTLIGTAATDIVVGLGGNDTVNAPGGKDTACGGDGNDTLNGGGGNDRLVGGPKKDVCSGGGGIDKAPSCEVEKGVP